MEGMGRDKEKMARSRLSLDAWIQEGDVNSDSIDVFRDQSYFDSATSVLYSN